jgi:hypothetical protein
LHCIVGLSLKHPWWCGEDYLWATHAMNNSLICIS